MILGAIATAGDPVEDISDIRTSLIVVQPTSLCNLNCSYCYVPNRQDARRMSESTLRTLAQRVFSSPYVNERVEFLWHAGEPLTVGLAFFREALRIIQAANERGVVVQHTIQTNATLVDEGWCDLFKENGFHIGVSIDGPEFLHDKKRKNWSGGGTHAATLRGYHLLRRYGVQCGGLCVLTADSLNYPSEILHFFLSEGFHSVGFNIEETEGVHATTSFHGDEMVSVQDRYEEFMTKLFDAHREYRGVIRIREFSNVVSSIRSKRQNPDFQETPIEARELGAVTIQRNGDTSTFSPEFASMPHSAYGSFVIGNIHDHSFVEMRQTMNHQRIKKEVQISRSLCAETCRYFDFCGGAFFSNKVAENGTLRSTETRSCRLHMQTLCSVVLQKLSQPASRIYRAPDAISATPL